VGGLAATATVAGFFHGLFDRFARFARAFLNPAHQFFLLDSASKGCSPQIKQPVIDLSLNGSGVRDTARVLGISPTTVIHELKKKGRHSYR